MARMKRKRKPIGRFIVLTTTIGMLNLIGIGYASWNNGLEINTLISTGNMKYEIIIDDMPYTSDEIFNNRINPTIYVNEGELENISYAIKKNGTIPIDIESLLTINGIEQGQFDEIQDESRYSASFQVPRMDGMSEQMEDETTHVIPFQITLSLNQDTN